ncbi:MAG TPA: hypothetical protein PKC23_06950 [Candidatus Desulfobacillus sp.]|nr:hypothetical protein [Candidatus Desulfobacillus sp.]
MKRKALLGAGIVAASWLLAGCEAIFTGATVETRALEAEAGGGFRPVTFRLEPEMSPVALNFRAELGNHPEEAGKWNAYAATLTRDGATVASGSFNVNYTGTVELPPANPDLVMVMLTTPVENGGEYQLTIRPLGPVEVTLQNPRVELRRNVELPAGGRQG